MFENAQEPNGIRSEKMNADEIVRALRENAEWCDANEYEVPLCMGDNQRAAADLIEFLQAQFSTSQRREKAAVELIDEIRSDATGDWSFIMFKIDNWRGHRKAFKLAPAIDAVEVVRCCDCKYSVVPYKDSDDNVPYLYCYHPNLDEDALSPKVDFTDFCSYGRRE